MQQKKVEMTIWTQSRCAWECETQVAVVLQFWSGRVGMMPHLPSACLEWTRGSWTALIVRNDK